MMADPETFLISVSERLWPIANRRFSDLSRPERVFILVWELEAEVNNGGFSQFYFNSAADRARDTAAALRTIGAERTASIVDRANASFPGGPPADRSARPAASFSIAGASTSRSAVCRRTRITMKGRGRWGAT